MSDMEEAYLLRIADYLDGKMSPSQEEGFMHELGQNPALREMFEHEVLMGALVRQDNLEAPAVPLHPERRLPRFRIVAAAAVFAGLVGAGIYIFSLNHRQTAPSAALPLHADTVLPRTQDTGGAATEPLDSRGDVAAKVSPDTLFARYQQPYDGVKDPVEVSYYYNLYRKGRYAEVLGARAEDFQVMGAGDSRNALLRRYMQLYKGLCWLDRDQPGKARRSLDSAWRSSGPGEAISYTAQWYSLLAALKEGDRAAIADLGGRLSRRPNPYQDRARKIVRAAL